MKRIFSLIMAVLMLCALCVPAFADVSYKDGATLSGEQVFDEKVELKGITTIESGASLTFNEGIVFSYRRNCTLTVKNGASVTINGNMDVGNGNSIIIEPGAEVTLNGELYYLGDGSLEIGGKLTGRCGVDPGSASFTVSPGGIIDMEFEYENSTVSLVNALKEYGAKAVEVDDGDYKWRVALCNHEHSYANYICDCGKPCLHESWTDGVCDACHYVCNHDAERDNGFCTVCGDLDPSQHTHDFTTGDTVGSCKCGETVPCPHAERDNGFCTVCGDLDPSQHTHDFTSGDTVGYCKCGDPCPHENTTTTCKDCNMEIASGATASTLSEGNLAIITAVAGVAFGFLAAMVIFKKKKPALASGENTDEE